MAKLIQTKTKRILFIFAKNNKALILCIDSESFYFLHFLFECIIFINQENSALFSRYHAVIHVVIIKWLAVYNRVHTDAQKDTYSVEGQQCFFQDIW